MTTWALTLHHDDVVSIRNEFAAVEVAEASGDGDRQLLWMRDLETGIETQFDAFFLSRLIRLVQSVDLIVPGIIACSIPDADAPLCIAATSQAR